MNENMMKYWWMNFWFALWRPEYWVMNYRFDKHWDEKLNELLDHHKFENIDNYTATIGGVEVWIANQPFASFRIRVGGKVFKETMDHRPSRITIERARNLLSKNLIEQLTKDNGNGQK